MSYQSHLLKWHTKLKLTWNWFKNPAKAAYHLSKSLKFFEEWSDCIKLSRWKMRAFSCEKSRTTLADDENWWVYSFLSLTQEKTVVLPIFIITFVSSVLSKYLKFLKQPIKCECWAKNRVGSGSRALCTKNKGGLGAVPRFGPEPAEPRNSFLQWKFQPLNYLIKLK